MSDYMPRIAHFTVMHTFLNLSFGWIFGIARRRATGLITGAVGCSRSVNWG